MVRDASPFSLPFPLTGPSWAAGWLVVVPPLPFPPSHGSPTRGVARPGRIVCVSVCVRLFDLMAFFSFRLFLPFWRAPSFFGANYVLGRPDPGCWDGLTLFY